MIAPTTGLNVNEWAKWRKNMLITGSYDPNNYDTLNSYQKQWTQDTLNTLRALSEEK